MRHVSAKPSKPALRMMLPLASEHIKPRHTASTTALITCRDPDSFRDLTSYHPLATLAKGERGTEPPRQPWTGCQGSTSIPCKSNDFAVHQKILQPTNAQGGPLEAAPFCTATLHLALGPFPWQEDQGCGRCTWGSQADLQQATAEPSGR